MRYAVYGAVLVIALASVLLSLDRLPAPMSPMIDTAAGLSAAVQAPTTQRAAPAPTAPMGAPIVPPTLAAPAKPDLPATAAPAAQAAVPAAPPAQVRCNIDACTAAYRSFRPSDCTYQPVDGPRRLCTK
jgi:hypothetical protein